MVWRAAGAFWNESAGFQLHSGFALKFAGQDPPFPAYNDLLFFSIFSPEHHHTGVLYIVPGQLVPISSESSTTSVTS